MWPIIQEVRDMKKGLKIILTLVTIALLASVAYATTNMHPTIQYVGEGEPSGTSYHDGDTYIDTSSLNMWIFNGSSNSWTTFARFMQPNVNGTNGENGATWWLVTQDPTTLPNFGNDHDFCLDSNTWNVWCKLSGQWQLIGNIKGADGIDGVNGTNGVNGANGADGVNGTDGKDGTIWYNDLAYNFSETIGKDGDYFMFANGTVEYKTNGTWVYFTSLMGQKGETGATGTVGATGATGATGIQGIQGIPGKDGINGTDGTDGINPQSAIPPANGTNGQDGVVPWWLYAVAALAVASSVYSVYKSRQKPKPADPQKNTQK